MAIDLTTPADLWAKHAFVVRGSDDLWFMLCKNAKPMDFYVFEKKHRTMAWFKSEWLYKGKMSLRRWRGLGFSLSLESPQDWATKWIIYIYTTCFWRWYFFVELSLVANICICMCICIYICICMCICIICITCIICVISIICIICIICIVCMICVICSVCIICIICIMCIMCIICTICNICIICLICIICIICI